MSCLAVDVVLFALVVAVTARARSWCTECSGVVRSGQQVQARAGLQGRIRERQENKLLLQRGHVIGEIQDKG